MKLSISNIAWNLEDDETVYRRLYEMGYHAIEIAPSRWLPQDPYMHCEQAVEQARALWEKWGLRISSMQSIWYQRQEKLFGSPVERQILLEYTKRAMDFAQQIGCRNLVFGCPRNRVRPEGVSETVALSFFHDCAVYAQSANTCLALEPNPRIYHTNYINNTVQAFKCVKAVDNPGFLVNVDLGTMLQECETSLLLKEYISLIHHVHISEPGLSTPVHEKLWKEVLSLLAQGGYCGYASIEMSAANGLPAVLETIERVSMLWKSIQKEVQV